MKRKYEKPMLFRECFKLDMAIAGTCTVIDRIMIEEINEMWKNMEGNVQSYEDFVESYLKDKNKPYCYHNVNNTVFIS